MIGSIQSPAGSLDQASNSLATSLNRLSTGRRINSAKDDAAGLAIASQMAAQLGSDNQALRNINDGLSLAETAGGALGQVSDTLQRMRELAVQAANGTNSPSDRQALQAEFSQLGQSIDQVATQTNFNGQQLFDGNFSTQLATGPNPGDTQPLALNSVSSQALGLGATDISSAQGATNALGAIDQALNSVSSQQANIGAVQSGLGSAAASLSGTYENLAAAKSRIADTDYASQSTDLAQSSVKQQAALKAVSLYNANQASLLALLPTK